ncbi:MAG: Maf family nucleotide pyrophosphatase [Flavobacteriaceae bacterium]|nr:Maf family nucleotide pyrophosphatase [Flavobacteriaceae bacterium]
MLKDKLSKYDIVLASKSPRRIQFLKDLDLSFRTISLDIDESYPKYLKSSEITDYIAIKKSKSFNENFNKNTLLITSDTIVWYDDKAIGKPKDNNHAKQILSELSGQYHEVITSVCIKTFNKKIVFNDITKVLFKKLSISEVEYYVQNYNVLDKAGSYGIQDWIGYVAIKSIEGTYNNVMGLPTNLLYEELLKI